LSTIGAHVGLLSLGAYRRPAVVNHCCPRRAVIAGCLEGQPLSSVGAHVGPLSLGAYKRPAVVNRWCPRRAVPLNARIGPARRRPLNARRVCHHTSSSLSRRVAGFHYASTVRGLRRPMKALPRQCYLGLRRHYRWPLRPLSTVEGCAFCAGRVRCNPVENKENEF